MVARLTRCLRIVAVMGCAAMAMLGIAFLNYEPPIPVRPTVIEYDVKNLDRTKFSGATQRVLQAMLTDRLPGATVAEHEVDLRSAQRIEHRGRLDMYHFQLMFLDRPYEAVEGLPFMFVMVDHKYGRIVQCGVAVPCF